MRAPEPRTAMNAPTARALALAAALLATAAAHAAAQTIGASDVTGPIITGSGVTGGSFGESGLTVLNVVFMDVEGRTFFTSRDVGCQVRRDVEALRARYEAGRLTPALRPGAGDYAEAERTVWGLLLAASPAPPEAARVRDALSGANPTAEQAVAADRLTRALTGLFLDREECPPEEDAPPADATRWAEAVQAYEAYLSSAPADVLGARRGELVAVHTVLHPILENAIRVGRRAIRGWRRF